MLRGRRRAAASLAALSAAALAGARPAAAPLLRGGAGGRWGGPAAAPAAARTRGLGQACSQPPPIVPLVGVPATQLEAAQQVAARAGEAEPETAAADLLGLPITMGLLPAPEEPLNTGEPWRRLKIVTGGDATYVAEARQAVDNQRRFAETHGYGHEVHVGNYASPWIAYWHKVDVLLRELRAPRPPEVLVWMDLDLLVTNPKEAMLERVLAEFPNKAMVLTEDAMRGGDVPGAEHAKRLVNTGVIILRSGPQAMRVLEALFDYGRQYRAAAYLPQDKETLHEQDAFNALLGGARRHVWSQHVAVIPQRRGALNLNTFARTFYDERFKDPAEAQWAQGDFTAHCTGLRRQQREWCVADYAALAEASLAAPGQNATASPSSGEQYGALGDALEPWAWQLGSSSMPWTGKQTGRIVSSF